MVVWHPVHGEAGQVVEQRDLEHLRGQRLLVLQDRAVGLAGAAGGEKQTRTT